MSLGQRQRLTYLRSSFHQKDIVLCDEPTGSLDPQNANEVMKQLYEESQYRLIIVVSHDLALIEKYCHEVYMMEDGHVKEHCFLKEKAFEVKRKCYFHVSVYLYNHYFLIKNKQCS